MDSLIKNNNKITLISLLFLSYLTGFLIISFFQTPEQMAWYKTLNQSPLVPPDITFSIVWSVLYFLMSVSAWLVWNKVKHLLFYGQYLLQLLWSFVFFQCQWLWTGVVVLLCLCFINAVLMHQFYKQSRLSGILFAPYVLWCMFATILNISVAWLN